MRIFLVSFSLVVGVATLFIHLYQVPETGSDLSSASETSDPPNDAADAVNILKEHYELNKQKPLEKQVLENKISENKTINKTMLPSLLHGTDIHGALAVD